MRGSHSPELLGSHWLYLTRDAHSCTWASSFLRHTCPDAPHTWPCSTYPDIASTAAMLAKFFIATGRAFPPILEILCSSSISGRNRPCEDRGCFLPVGRWLCIRKPSSDNLLLPWHRPFRRRCRPSCSRTADTQDSC